MLLLGTSGGACFCCEVLGICVHGSALFLVWSKAYQNMLGERDTVILFCFWCQVPSSGCYTFLKVSASVGWLS